MTGALPKQFNPLGAKGNTAARVVLGPDRAFPLLGNVGAVGDCTIATVADVVIADHLSGRLGTVPRFSTTSAIATWHRLNGNTSDGVTDERLLDAWDSTKGILGTRITGWRALGTADLTEMKKAIEADGAIYAGIVVPDDIGSLGSIWDASVSSTALVGGHALALDGWTPQGFVGITFGGVVLIPFAWWTSHAESAYAVSLVARALARRLDRLAALTGGPRSAVPIAEHFRSVGQGARRYGASVSQSGTRWRRG